MASPVSDAMSLQRHSGPIKTEYKSPHTVMTLRRSGKLIGMIIRWECHACTDIRVYIVLGIYGLYETMPLNFTALVGT